MVQLSVMHAGSGGAGISMELTSLVTVKKKTVTAITSVVVIAILGR